MINIQLTTEEFELLCAQVDATTPSGGGSKMNSLKLRLREQAPHWDLNRDDDYLNQVIHLQWIAANEYLVGRFGFTIADLANLLKFLEKAKS